MDQLVNARTPYYILKFSAKWCKPCQIINPIFEKLATNKDYRNIQFVKVDVNKATDLSNKFKINSYPTFIIIDSKQIELERFSGANEIILINHLNKYKWIMNNDWLESIYQANRLSVYYAIRVDNITTSKMKYNFLFVMHYMYSAIAYTI